MLSAISAACFAFIKHEKCWFPGNFSNSDVCKWMLWHLVFYSKNIAENTVLVICGKPDLSKSWVFLDLVLLISKTESTQ